MAPNGAMRKVSISCCFTPTITQLSESPLITQLCESTLIIDSQVRLIFYCLAATDRVICIYKFTSCFCLMLPLLDPKAPHAV